MSFPAIASGLAPRRAPISSHFGQAVSVLVGNYSRKLHHAYTLFFLIGTAGALQVPVIGWQPLQSLEQLCVPPAPPHRHRPTGTGLRVRGEIMGSKQCRNVGKAQSILKKRGIMIESHHPPRAPVSRRWARAEGGGGGGC
jgi:hypothetical protein